MPLNRDHVGQRVIVRRLLPGETGPSGGPAMTDVLGVLAAFDSSSLAVERDDGELVTILRADLVTGKPIPPRPVARMRISAAALQRICAAGWVAPDHEQLGEHDGIATCQHGPHHCLGMAGGPAVETQPVAGGLVTEYDVAGALGRRHEAAGPSD